MNREQRRISYGMTFTSENGAGVLADLEARFCGTTVRKDNNGAVDPIAMAHAEGERNVVLWIKNQMKPKEETK